jgi:hypothetical protein
MTAPARFYDGTPGRELVPCPDCGRPCDATIGDHFGICRDAPSAGRRRNGAEIIRDYAETHQFLSVNDVRPLLVAAGVPEKRRGPAFTTACNRGWIEQVGYEPSGSARTKGHHVHRYRSCVGQWARDVAEAK